MGKKPYPRLQDYTVGWIAALPVELAAALEMIDEEYPLPEDFPRDDDDGNLYVFGRIGSHNIVFSSLPAGTIGTNSTASLAVHLRTKFKRMKFGLLVGITGAAPSSSHDIRLGDVVVSTPNEQFGGVVQWDFGKSTSGGLFHRTGHLNAPPRALLNNLAYIRARELLGKLSVSEHLSVFDMLPTFNRAKAGPDILYEGETPKARPQRNSTDPVVHYGTIASGNQVIKDRITRDRLSQELNEALCFEMEAAGLMNDFPCLVIRGMCDYADEHKNKSWQPYAAATAAAWAKQFLSVLPASSSESGEIVPPNAKTSEKLDKASEGDMGLPGGPRRGRPRKVRGDIKHAGRALIQVAFKKKTLIKNTDNNLRLESEGKENSRRQLSADVLSNMFKRPAPRKALFTMFDRSTNVNFYREVYYGNGTLIRNVINNQRGNISSSGGSVNFGNVTGSMHSNNVQGARRYGTSAYNSIQDTLRTRPHLTWGSWEMFKRLKTWIRKR